MCYYIGIDPGITGAITIFEDNNYLTSFVLPTVTTIKNKKKKKEIDVLKLYGLLNDYVKKGKAIVIAIEKVHSITGQGISSAFSFGYTTGHLSAISQIIADRYIEVTPQTWQKELKYQFFTPEIIKDFKNNNIDNISQYITNKKLKEFFIKTANLKSTKETKLESLFLYYLIEDKNDTIEIDYKNNNIVDSYLIAYYCYLKERS